MLHNFVKAEYELCMKYVSKIVYSKMRQSKKYSCAQGIHDGVTLINVKKYQAIGLQFVCQNWSQKFILCIGFK